MKSTTDRFRSNKDVKGFAFAEQYLNLPGYTTSCPFCGEKLVLSKLTSEQEDLLKHKEVIDYNCFVCHKPFKVKLKTK